MSHHHHHHHQSFQDPGISKDAADKVLSSMGEQLMNSNGTNFFAQLMNMTTNYIQSNPGHGESSDSSQDHSQHMGVHTGEHMGGHSNHMNHQMDTHSGDAHASHNIDAHATAGHASHGTDHGMATYFYFGYENVQMLIKPWILDDLYSLIVACLILMVICVGSEWIKIWRENLTTRMIFRAQKKLGSSSRSEGILESGTTSSRGSDDYLLQPVATNFRDGLSSRLHIILSITYTIQQFISLFVMLVFMTFNLYLCITIVLSHGLGFYLFGWRRMIMSNGGNLMSDTGACH